MNNNYYTCTIKDIFLLFKSSSRCLLIVGVEVSIALDHAQ